MNHICHISGPYSGLQPSATRRIEKGMTQKKAKAAAEFRKPAHWTNDPVPEPQAIDTAAKDPKGLSPTRYGDWVKDGVAIDF